MKFIRKSFYEKALNAELDDHFGYQKHAASGADNTRNGQSSKTVYSDSGALEIQTPRDRNGDFEPQAIKKRQARLPLMDAKIIYLYSKGMSTREISEILKELYDTEVSATLISRVTDAVLEQVINKAIYLALGANMQGHKELLGLWMSENEGAKFWLSVLTELQNRGVKDILIACVDGLKGFPVAINAVFPETQIQLCIVHMVHNSMKYVPWKDYKAIAADLKLMYPATSEDEALLALDRFGKKWNGKRPQISRSWRHIGRT
jgi:putative transposase